MLLYKVTQTCDIGFSVLIVNITECPYGLILMPLFVVLNAPLFFSYKVHPLSDKWL